MIRRLSSRIRYPIIQAPMARASMDEMVVSVSNTGVLGSIGAGYLPPDDLRKSIRNIYSKTKNPFQVNLQVRASIPDIPHKNTDRFNTVLDQIKKELSITTELKEPQKLTYSFNDQLQVVLDERVPVFSFTFGCPTREQIEQLHNNDTIVMGTATSVAEAKFLEEQGVDYIIAQGSESGGHRGTFLSDIPSGSEIYSTMTLLPMIVNAVKIPVIATGGIYNAQGIKAAFSLGASAVALGTVFLPCKESQANDLWKKSLLDRTRNRPTIVTKAVTGRYCRVIKNTLVEKIGPVQDDVRPLPYHAAYMKPIADAAQKQGNDDYIPLLAGQGYQQLQNVDLKDYPSCSELCTSLIRELEDYELPKQF